MSQGYAAKGDIDQVAGALGPLYYVTVSIAGEPVEAMGSSATILSFELFKRIGKKANIPDAPDVVLRDYSQRPIPVGAKVDLEISYNGKSVKVRAGFRKCRIGGVSAGNQCCYPTGNYVTCRTQRKRIPCQRGVVVEAQIEGGVPGSTVLFEPSLEVWAWTCLCEEGKIFVPIRNASLCVQEI